MFRAIGIVIILYALTQMMSGAYHAFEDATIAVLQTLQTAAQVSQTQLLDEYR